MKRLIFFLLVVPLSALSNDRELCQDWACGGHFDAPAGSICEGWKFNIEPDMQIYDIDLTEENAQKAVDWLAENLTKEGHLISFGKENSLKRIRGYILKKSFLDSNSPNKEIMRKSYCTWLKNDGFWYD